MVNVYRDKTDDTAGRPALSTRSTLLGSATAGFIIKYDRQGNVVWRRSIEGAEPGTGGSSISGVVVDGSGNLFVTGVFTNSQAQRFGGLTLSEGE